MIKITGFCQIWTCPAKQFNRSIGAKSHGSWRMYRESPLAQMYLCENCKIYSYRSISALAGIHTTKLRCSHKKVPISTCSVSLGLQSCFVSRFAPSCFAICTHILSRFAPSGFAICALIFSHFAPSGEKSYISQKAMKAKRKKKKKLTFGFIFI